MAFPTHDQQMDGAQFRGLDDPEVFRAIYGETKTYTTFTNAPGVFAFFVIGAPAEAASWQSHFDSNGTTTADTFTWQVDSSAHSCYWEGPPQITQPESAPHLRVVRVRLRVAS